VTLGVRLLLLRKGDVLLVKHTYMSGWYLPGGRPEPSESLAATASREAREEVGVHVEDVELFGLFSHLGPADSDHVAVFVGWSEEEAVASSLEIEAVGTFSLTALPDDLSEEARAILGRWRAKPRCVYDIV
jgi:ADP-ribose pyrophosphatase YjhB (NUDIX family)